MASTSQNRPLPTLATPPIDTSSATTESAPDSASASASADSDSASPSTATTVAQKLMDPRQKQRLSRPTLGSRKSSGTLIIPRDSPTVEVKTEEYEEDDARAMSPRRSSEEIDKMGDDARAALEEQANTLQNHLLEIIDRVNSVQSETEKIEGGNKFLQSYIGELISTSKVTGAAKSKKRNGK